MDAAIPPPTQVLTASLVDQDEFEALELSRRVAVSDIGTTTLAALEEAANSDSYASSTVELTP